MTDAPNILTTRQRCNGECPPKSAAATGDVQRCEHGRIWRCTKTIFLFPVRYWDRLTWWRAHRALRAPSTPDNTDPRLIAALTELGREFGPLGVALVAAQRTDTSVLIQRLTQQRDPAPAAATNPASLPELPAPTGYRDDGAPYWRVGPEDPPNASVSIAAPDFDRDPHAVPISVAVIPGTWAIADARSLALALLAAAEWATASPYCQ